jgi:hypothetical protein
MIRSPVVYSSWPIRAETCCELRNKNICVAGSNASISLQATQTGCSATKSYTSIFLGKEYTLEMYVIFQIKTFLTISIFYKD